MRCSLEFESGYDIRVHAEADTAFVYRPVILESLSATYLIGWGDAAMVRKVQEWSNGIGEVNLFSYPAKEVIASTPDFELALTNAPCRTPNLDGSTWGSTS